MAKKTPLNQVWTEKKKYEKTHFQAFIIDGCICVNLPFAMSRGFLNMDGSFKEDVCVRLILCKRSWTKLGASMTL
jgi:hypothetical protein